ncbi:MAG: T9SS type A sorting domain-containing protein [Bacteroidota bacterium]
MKKIVVGVLLTIAVTFGPAQKSVMFKTSHEEQSVLYQWKHFDGNRINATMNSAGPYADYLETASAGLEWPKGTGKTAIFTAGIWIIGKHHPTDSLRTAIQYYQTEFQPGPILGTFNTSTNDTSVAANPYDPKFRIYKINKGDDGNSNPDYADWPGDLGAPYNDINNNGAWDKGIDTPKLYGDQTLWCVYNDLNKYWHSISGVTPPMGIEIQATYFGFDTDDFLKDIMFMKWKIINKSDAGYDSVFIGMWSDTDMGDSNDDQNGSDSLLQLNYVYNDDNDDGGLNGYGSTPPACGFTFLQGPIVVSTINDSAQIEDRIVRGYRNLRATSSMAILKNFSFFSDPWLSNSKCARNIFYYMNGLNSLGAPIIDSTTHAPSKFMFAGDPVAGTGTLVSTWHIVGGDKRSLISSGPFAFAKGDTQEVIGAFVIAEGTDRLNSITLLKQSTSYVHSFYVNNPSFILNVYEHQLPPASFHLDQNFPNPFNPATTIRYSLSKQALASITIYNILGQKVRTVLNEVKNAGTYEVEWNGRSDGGISVASGMFFYRMTTDGFTMTKKMLMLK